MEDLKGRVAVVTGGASGIGRAVALRCAAEGMNVVCADIDAGGADETARAIADAGGSAIAHAIDVSEEGQWSGLAEATLGHFGRIDLLCNHAGVLIGGACWELSADDYAWVLRVNLLGVVHGVRTFVPIMSEQDFDSHIVNGASIGGLSTELMLAPYSIAMKGVIGYSESLFHELALHGKPIGVSLLCPAAVDTSVCDADRNRPPRFGRARAPESRLTPLFDEHRREGVAAGMPPAAVAEKVLTAVRERRFWITPKGAWFRDRVEASQQRMLRREDPVVDVSWLPELPLD